MPDTSSRLTAEAIYEALRDRICLLDLPPGAPLREQAIAKAETALEEAKRDYETKVEEMKRARAALDRRSQAEDARWEKQKEKLETALRRARE